MQSPKWMSVLKNIAKSTSIYKKYVNQKFYPGLGLSYQASIINEGAFDYKEGVIISSGVKIHIENGSKLCIYEECYVGRDVEISPARNIEIHQETSIQDRCIILGDVKIGRSCVFAPNIYISSGRHYYGLRPFWLIKDQDQFVNDNQNLRADHSKPIVIGDDCWIGINSVIMPGITIGNGSIVGANSVVTRDIKPYTVVAGSPAKEIKKRINFIPPSKIHYLEQEQLPYFYTGFGISKKELESDRPHGGLSAAKSFVIFLNATIGTEVHLIIKVKSNKSSFLVYNEQKNEVRDSFQEIIFKISENSFQTLQFEMTSEDGKSQYIIKEAWIQ